MSRSRRHAALWRSLLFAQPPRPFVHLFFHPTRHGFKNLHEWPSCMLCGAVKQRARITGCRGRVEITLRVDSVTQGSFL